MINKSDVSTRSSLIDVSAFSVGIYSVALYCGRSKTHVKFVKSNRQTKILNIRFMDKPISEVYRLNTNELENNPFSVATISW